MKVLVAPFLVATWLVFVHRAFAAEASTNLETERYASRCQSRDRYRHNQEQGTDLLGVKQSWNPHAPDNQASNVLRSAYLDRLLLAVPGTPAGVHNLRLDKGWLTPSSAGPDDAPGKTNLIGLVLQARSSAGPTEVAICGAEPADHSRMVWYHIKIWNPVAQAWENPCVATMAVRDPRALAVNGVWDETGAHRDSPAQFTFACENGAIAKCVQWGYEPWESRDGQSLAKVHQACTRMARADYCGNGRSHTLDGTSIDIYDTRGILTPETGTLFEADWAPDGATCINQTRRGDPVDTILRECPGRFRVGTEIDLGDGDRCAVRRTSARPSAGLVRNRLYR